ATALAERPVVQLGRPRASPRLSLPAPGPPCAVIHHPPPHPACFLRPCWPPSPCSRLSRPRTTTGPPSHPGGISRRRAFPPTGILLAGEGTAGMVPTFTLNRSPGEVSSYAPAASPRLRRRPSPWPPGQRR